MISLPDFDEEDLPKTRTGQASSAAFAREASGARLFGQEAADSEGGRAFSGGISNSTAAISVSELNRRARGLMERSFPLLLVAGEISNFARAASGHVYFVLKDRAAQVRCTLWRNKAALLDWRPQEGDQVEVRATVTLFEARGEFQLTVESIRRAGAGALFEQFLRLKAKLADEGLFDAANKRQLPAYPRGIGLVTSPNAAALADVLIALKRRAPMIPVVLYPAPVQGADAAARLTRAVQSAAERAATDGIDVLILCRGGGSLKDLWSFNDEVLARAIAACPIPVVSGVGHETDFTICDFAADVRAATPTAAAELVSPDVEVLHSELAGLARALHGAWARGLQACAQQLDWLQQRLQPPSARLKAQRLELEHLDYRLRHAARGQLEETLQAHARRIYRLRQAKPQPAQHSARVQAMSQRLARAMRHLQTLRAQTCARTAQALELLAPQRVLERGYSVTTNAAGEIVRSAAGLQSGAPLSVQFARGSASVAVTSADST